jgi:hypothetical protein
MPGRTTRGRGSASHTHIVTGWARASKRGLKRVNFGLSAGGSRGWRGDIGGRVAGCDGFVDGGRVSRPTVSEMT